MSSSGSLVLIASVLHIYSGDMVFKYFRIRLVSLPGWRVFCIGVWLGEQKSVSDSRALSVDCYLLGLEVQSVKFHAWFRDPWSVIRDPWTVNRDFVIRDLVFIICDPYPYQYSSAPLYNIHFLLFFFQSVSFRYTGAYTDPCLPLEYTEKGTYKGEEYKFIGTGDFQKCQETLMPLLNLTVPCSKPPCSLNGVYQPHIDYTHSEFYGFSEYWYSMHDVLRIGGQYSSKKMRRNAEVSVLLWMKWSQERKSVSTPVQSTAN